MNSTRTELAAIERLRIGALVLFAAGAIAATQPAFAQDTPARAATPAAADTAGYRDSIVRIDAQAVIGAASADTLGKRRVGSGVILDERHVLTIGYLLLETESVELTTASGKRIPANVAGYDHATGFGLLRSLLPLEGKALELGDSDRLAERQKVLTIGQGESEATELYVLSRKPFVGSWEYLLDRAIYTFPPVNNWSGSALVTEDGKLVGIGSLIVNDAASDRRGVPGNMFVPVNLLKPILADLRDLGKRSGPVQPWLGMSTEQVRGHLMVVRVSRDGPAEGAGVDPGDIVMAVDGENVVDQAEFYRKVWKLGPAGTEVTLKMLKAGVVRDIKLRSIDRIEVLAKPAGV